MFCETPPTKAGNGGTYHGPTSTAVGSVIHYQCPDGKVLSGDRYCVLVAVRTVDSAGPNPCGRSKM